MNIVSQMRVSPNGLPITKIWQVPDELELAPDEDWVEQNVPGLSPIPGVPPA